MSLSSLLMKIFPSLPRSQWTFGWFKEFFSRGDVTHLFPCPAAKWQPETWQKQTSEQYMLRYMVTFTYHTQDRHFETCQVAMSSQSKGMDILLYRYPTWKFVHRISLEFLTITNNSQCPSNGRDRCRRHGGTLRRPAAPPAPCYLSSFARCSITFGPPS